MLTWAGSFYVYMHFNSWIYVFICKTSMYGMEQVWVGVCLCTTVCLQTLAQQWWTLGRENEEVSGSDELSACCRLSLWDRHGYNVTQEGQLRVIGSLALGWDFTPRQDFKRESDAEGKWNGEEWQSRKFWRVLKNENAVHAERQAGGKRGRRRLSKKAKRNGIV